MEVDNGTKDINKLSNHSPPTVTPAGANRKYSERRRSEPTASRVWTHQKLAEHSKETGAKRPIEKIKK